MHSRSPLLVAGDVSPSNFPHPFAQLPAEMLSKISALPDGESLAGLGGMLFYFNHFLQWEGPLVEGSAGGWTLSNIAGVGTITQPNVRIGAIAITADATVNSDPTLALGGAAAPANFIYAVGKRMWCFARLKLDIAATAESFFGFGTPDTEPTVTNTFPSDGIFFDKAAAATKYSFNARKAGTSTQKLSATAALIDDTYTTLGFIVDIGGNIIPFQDGAALAAGVIPAGTANIPGAANPMQFMVGHRAASKITTLDWLLLAQEI